jgi:hypothetical protein
MRLLVRPTGRFDESSQRLNLLLVGLLAALLSFAMGLGVGWCWFRVLPSRKQRATATSGVITEELADVSM